MSREDDQDIIYLTGPTPGMGTGTQWKMAYIQVLFGEEISNYAHSFYARLGMNVFLCLAQLRAPSRL